MAENIRNLAIECCIEARSLGGTPDPFPLLFIILAALWFYSRLNRIAGVAKVLSGNIITVNGEVIRLYAMYGLMPNQAWIGPNGIKYDGGERSRAALADKIDGKHVICKIQPKGGVAKGAKVCKVFLDGEDVAKMMVQEGHAMADAEPTRRKVYLRAQEHAQKKGLELHQGRFLHPYLWYLLENQRKNKKLRAKLSKDELRQLDDEKIKFEDGLKLGFRIWKLFIDGGASDMIAGAEKLVELRELVTDTLA